MIKIQTAQYNYSESDRLDITVKGKDKLGSIFAPSWEIVNGYKNGTLSEKEYELKYYEILDNSYKQNRDKWEEFFNLKYVTLVCFCKKQTFCHRYLLILYLIKHFKNKIIYEGEFMKGKKQEIDYTKKLMELAESCLTKKGYKLLLFVEDKIPDIWDLPSSSTGKYHQKADGSVPSIAEHVYEMVFALSKTIKMLGDEIISTKNDAILIATILHDSLKYGPTGKAKYTFRNHEKLMADFFADKKKVFLKHFSEDEFNIFIDCIRYHSGRWSSDVKDKKTFNFSDYRPEILIVHFLDMLSTNDCLVCNQKVDYDDLPF